MGMIANPQLKAARGPLLVDWRPEDPEFWARTGKRIAARNLWISIPALLLAFAVWMIWSTVTVRLNAAGFSFSNDQLFLLAALPSISGATLRIFYSFMVPIFGGRRWTALSTASLLIPCLWLGFAVQDPTTPYWVFATSIAGQGVLFHDPKSGLDSSYWLANAGFIWVPFIVAATLAAWFGMNDIASAQASLADQAVIFKRKHNWLMCWLYVGTFGSFIGFSAAFAMLIKAQFPEVEVARFAFLGPLAGALARPLGGMISDRIGGARVTLWVFLAMGLTILLGILPALHTHQFMLFLASFIGMFILTGLGNGSTFCMIPIIFQTERERATAGQGEAAQQQARLDAGKESAAVLGFSGAIGAYGGFFIPQSFGTSIRMTGAPDMAMFVFVGFYASCMLITWWYYARKGAPMPC